MKVLKFGGTSVGSAENIKRVKAIIESDNISKIIVVSALGGVTDMLIETAHKAVEGDKTYLEISEQIKQKHLDIIHELFTGEVRADVENEVLSLIDELKNIYKGVYLIQELSKRSLDTISTYGERMSSLIVSRFFGLTTIDSREVIKTFASYGKDVVDFKTTADLIKKHVVINGHSYVVPGFISSNKLGETTTLGRGGSDYTASIFAATLDAEILEIWTDVDGFMTADPRIISKAYPIEKLSYAEAMELSHFGAKVIYPPTIFPVLQKEIPIRIKNTLNPDADGTYISKEKIAEKPKMIKGISSINDTCLVTMSGAGMVGVIGINYRLFKALSDANVSVFLVSQASSENSTSLAVKNSDAEKAEKAMRDEFKNELAHGDINSIIIEKDLATIAIVGENMKHTPGIAGKLFNVLGQNGINVIACAQGASELNISFVVTKNSLRKALNVIHEAFFLSAFTELNLFLVGVGLVGGNLMDQIAQQQPKLLKENHLRIKIAGVANSRKFIINRDGLDLNGIKDQLAESKSVGGLDGFKQEIIDLNLYNSVFVDCTASEVVADLYSDLIQHNFHIVTANKVAASSAYENYSDLKTLAKRKGVKYLFETNVGAGLPIINTMNALIRSGDKIEKLEAVLSGTLNFIFNTLSADVPLSRAIELAKEAGFSEPDPRIDLSGVDVIRKVVILAREAGHNIEQSDVIMKPFLPESVFEGSIDNFWKGIKELDAQFEESRKVLESENKKLRFVGKMDQGKASVELIPVDSSHPFYELEGSNNIILLTTERYNEYPMMIKGYGAGAGVTAAGVFADIISIANPY